MNRHHFTVITRNYPLLGGAIKYLQSMLKKKSIRVDFGCYLNMPSNDLVLVYIEFLGILL